MSPAAPGPDAGREPGPSTWGGDEGSLSHALRLLEFSAVLELVARSARSELGARELLGLRPSPRRRRAVEALRAVEEMAAFLRRSGEWAPPGLPDLAPPIRRLRTEASILEPGELLGLAALLEASRRVREVLLPLSGEAPRVARLARHLAAEPALEERLRKCFDRSGGVSDGASPELRRLRRELRRRRAELVERLEGFAAALPERLQVPDASVTLRNGRYCIPVRREGRGQVGGIVHDESTSRQTLFVEPPVAIEPMNRIRELELAEEREVRRILRALTESLRPRSGALWRSLRSLAKIDSLHARARYALAHGGFAPELGDEAGRGPYRVVRGRHPLLLASGRPVVPFDLELTEEESLLLVSGPNAGGKTVLLKTIGLLSAMAQSGILPPVGPGTRLPTFRGFFAMIGDEQSLEASLSTFGAQVMNLRAILARSDERSLVLLDEVGGHTDPSEGAALAAAVLLRIAGQAGLTVATTHLGELKTLAGESGRIVNASLQFDARNLRPTYQLRRDRPGRSYALEIARRLGLPETVVQEARRRLSDRERALDVVLERLEAREKELATSLAAARRRTDELGRAAAEVKAQRAELERREREAEERVRAAERRAREDAVRYLLEARRRVEAAIRGLEERYGPAAAEGAAGGRRRRRAASEARREVERALREVRSGMPERPAGEPRPEATRLREGDRVRILPLGRHGRVVERRGERAVVRAGGVRLTLPVTELRLAGEGSPGEAEGDPRRGGRGGAGLPAREREVAEVRPQIEPRMEVDLRGLRTDEVERAVLLAVDAAILGDLPRLRIVHGKGTGALGRRVREILRSDDRARRFRPGRHDEGGSGVTVVEFEESDS